MVSLPRCWCSFFSESCCSIKFYIPYIATFMYRGTQDEVQLLGFDEILTSLDLLSYTIHRNPQRHAFIFIFKVEYYVLYFQLKQNLIPFLVFFFFFNVKHLFTPLIIVPAYINAIKTCILEVSLSFKKNSSVTNGCISEILILWHFNNGQ